jgi:hypothetical protein
MPLAAVTVIGAEGDEMSLGGDPLVGVEGRWRIAGFFAVHRSIR